MTFKVLEKGWLSFSRGSKRGKQLKEKQDQGPFDKHSLKCSARRVGESVALSVAKESDWPCSG